MERGGIFEARVRDAVSPEVSAHFNIPTFARLAPHAESTRTLKAESVTVANSFLKNVRSNAYSLLVVLKASLNKAKSDSRSKGHRPGSICGDARPQGGSNCCPRCCN